jgi:thiamine-phosphate pyrophosphorylase
VCGVVYARQVAQQVSIPAVGIAGITLDNVDDVLATGLKAVAVTQAVVGAADIRGSAAQFKAKLAAKERG